MRTSLGTNLVGKAWEGSTRLNGKGFSKSRAISVTALMMVLLVAVACGSATAPQNMAPAPAAPAVNKPVDSVPTVPAVAAPNAPAEVKVNPGTVTVMIGSLGNERFDYAFSRGTGHDMARILHAFLISSDVEEGSREFTPGIATKWEISSDGLTWALNIRDGVKWHDGTELTTEDVLRALQHLMGPQATDYYTGLVCPP